MAGDDERVDGEKEVEVEIEYTVNERMEATLFQTRVCCGIGWIPAVAGIIMLAYGLAKSDITLTYCGIFFVATFGGIFIIPGVICGCCYLSLRAQVHEGKVSPYPEKLALP
ncbi:uncharacterized protein LOC135491008 [Lineus longissimus]|uniref:uncharacterized protein LOC135491008 n=1 Tax=Lineus longissimus TaxID=88925 RepID=UPI002B4F7FCA